MTDTDIGNLLEQTGRLLDIYDQFSPVQDDRTFLPDAVKQTVLAMAEFIIGNTSEAAALKGWMERSGFWTSPASTRFHGNFRNGLALHTLAVIHQSLVFTEPVIRNFACARPDSGYVVTAEDIFVSALAHDFCKAGVYMVEYRNTKDISGNWIKQPYFKTRPDARNLGHGNESVLLLLESMPSFIGRRPVLEAVSRHMGFSDLSESESYNYSNFLQNPLVVLLQLADQTAANWFNC